MKPRRAFKLLRLRRDGTLGPLFINRRQVIPVGKWLPAEDHPTKGYAHRPGWHVLRWPHAPHLSKTGRVWCHVLVDDFVEHVRPANQGGVWYLAKRMKIVSIA